MDKTQFIDVSEKIRISYKILNEGEESLFCFHGFGQDAKVFIGLEKKFPSYRIISFDLPFHGESQFPEKKIDKNQWKKISEEIFTYFDVSTVSILAYSMGGRFAIRMSMDFPEKLNEVTFIAADGFHYTGLYKFATSFIGKPVFKFILKRPEAFFKLTKKMSEIGLISKSMVKFAHIQLGEKEQRIKVYNTWVYLRPLATSQKELVNVLNKSKIKINIFVGSKDYVIKEEYFKYIHKGYSSTNLKVLDKRHHEMIEGFIHCH